jgi:MFS family permease
LAEDASPQPRVERPHLRDGMELLCDRDFPKLFGAHLVSWFGTSMVPIAMAFGVLQLTGSTSATGVVIASQIAAQFVVVLFGGVVADRVSRRRVIVTANVAAMVGQAAMAAALISNHASVPLLMFLMAWNGIAGAFHGPALVGFLPQVVTQERLHAANALLGTARSGAFALGAACGGILVAMFGSGATIAIDAFGFGIAALLVSRIRSSEQPAVASATLLEDLRGGWAEFTSHRWLWVIVLQFSLVVASAESVYGLIGPAVAKASMGGPPDWGFISAAFGAGTLCGGFIALRLHVIRPMLFATNCVFVGAAPALMLAMSTRVWLIAVATFANGVCGQIFGVLWNTTLQRKIPADLLSRVSAYDALGSIGLAPLGVIAAGFLLESIGARTTLLIAAAMVIVPTALALLEPDVRRLRFDS